MKVLTHALYKKHCELYTEIHGLIAVNSCQMKLARKNIILLSNVSIIFYKSGSHTVLEKNRFIRFYLSAGTYSIDNFNAKIKVAVLQEKQDWEPPQIKDLKLAIPRDYAFRADNTIFIALLIQDKISWVRSALPPGSYKTFFYLLPKNLSLHCKQINKVKTS